MRLALVLSTLTLIIVAGSATVSVAGTSAKPLTSNDIADINRICRSFFGAPAKDIETFLRPLASYARSKDELSKPQWVCSSQHCSGRVALRDEAEIVYGFTSIPEPSASDPMDITPDAVRKGNNRINVVGLVRHRKIVFVMPAEAAPFLQDQHHAR